MKQTIYIISLLLLFCGVLCPLFAQAGILTDKGIALSAIQRIDSGSLYFPVSINNDEFAAVVFQEVLFDRQDSGRIYISVAVYNNAWRVYRRVTDAVEFSRESPPHLFSAQINQQNEIIIAVLEGATTIAIYSLPNNAPNFQKRAEIATNFTTVAPQLFIRKNGSIICFLSSRDAESQQQIQYIISDDLENWSSVRDIVSGTNNAASFLPTYTTFGNREIVVYQSLAIGESSTQQLYFTYSDNSTRSWSRPTRLTQFRLQDEADAINSHDNQRPALLATDNALYLAWERKGSSGGRRILFVEMDRNGKFISSPIPVTDSVEAFNPEILSVQRRAYLLWYAVQGNTKRVNLSVQNNDGTWSTDTVSGNTPSDFSSFVRLNNDTILLNWLENSASRNTRVVARRADLLSSTVQLRGDNFSIGTPSNQKIAQVTWTVPQSSLQIATYQYSWSQNVDVVPQQSSTISGQLRSLQLVAEQEGRWFLKVLPVDEFGNTLQQVELVYTYDNSAPQQVVLEAVAVDEQGIAVSNTFDIRWAQSSADDVAGYATHFQRIGNTRAPVPQNVRFPAPASPNTLNAQFPVRNAENGLWQFTVAPIDNAGNRGPPAQIFLRLNNYRPITLIYSVSSQEGADGISFLSIRGKGFKSDGTIEQCILDADQKKPYDYILDGKDDSCAVLSDAAITNIPLSTIQKGLYFIGLNHPNRGITFSNTAFELLPSGSVLFGEFDTIYVPKITTFTPPLSQFAFIQNRDILFYFVLSVLFIAVILLSIRIIKTLTEGAFLRKEIVLLVDRPNNQYTTGEAMSELKKLKIRGTSLRLKFTFFITLLVITVILSISWILGNASLSRQERILASGLKERVSVLLDSITTQAGLTFIDPVNLALELGTLTNQSNVLQEAEYVTITGKSRDNDLYNTVWVTNDSRILQPNSQGESATPLIDTVDFNSGTTILNDAIKDEIADLRLAINQRAVDTVGTLPTQIIAQNQEIIRVITQGSATAGGIDEQLISELDTQLRTLTNDIFDQLRVVKADVLSFPTYNSEQLDTAQTQYIFYQPIVAWSADAVGTSGEFYQGLVRIGISTENLIDELATARRELIVTTVIIAIVAMIVGAVGASILAAIVVAPINRVVRGVELISATEDKSDLREHVITIRSKDEISLLAQSVNQMTRGLVKASDANKELIVGKEIQKLFIPLQKDDAGQKLSIANNDYDGLQIAGYYEGAHGVSGDYFSYVQIDADHFAVIKCDVSGKGVPAALIMVEVATIFSDFSSNYSNRIKPGALSKLVVRINDILESMHFEGRFAALTVAMINQKSGLVRVTNAGDRQVHVYRKQKRMVEVINLPETPASGVFHSTMLPKGFVEIEFILNSGDCILFFTDGVDESRRCIRDEKLQTTSISAEEAQKISGYEETTEAIENEEFSIERIHAITICAMNKEQYQLKYAFDSQSDERLLFNFESLSAQAMDLVKSIIAIEKIFRLRRISPNIKDDALKIHDVQIDKALENFLRTHFNQFDAYFQSRIEQDPKVPYAKFQNLFEEIQYDDLTLVVILKK